MSRARLTIEPALQQMGGSHSILWRITAEPLRKRGRESLVGRLDRDGDERPQRGHKELRLGGLLAVLAAERQREPNHHTLGLMVGDEPSDFCETGVGGCLPNDADGSRDRAARVRDSDACPGSPVIQREDSHAYFAVFGISALAFFSWMLPAFASLVALFTSGVISVSLFPAFTICTALIRRAPALPKFTNDRFASSFRLAPVLELGVVVEIAEAPWRATLVKERRKTSA